MMKMNDDGVMVTREYFDVYAIRQGYCYGAVESLIIEMMLLIFNVSFDCDYTRFMGYQLAQSTRFGRSAV